MPVWGTQKATECSIYQAWRGTEYAFEGLGGCEKSVKLKNEVLIEIDWGTPNPWPCTNTGIDFLILITPSFATREEPPGKFLSHTPCCPESSSCHKGMYELHHCDTHLPLLL